MTMKKYLLMFLIAVLLVSCGQSPQAQIKGNITASGDKIYHMPNQQFYEVTKAEKYFNTESEAKAAGFRKSKR
jgi:micrococcal nuclease